MKYPENCKSVVDVTKAPYYADNTGKIDCTKILCAAFDDCLKEYINGIEKVRNELLELHEKYDGNVYVGAEAGKYIDDKIYITFPKEIPPVKSLYFPNGKYLISDTISYTLDNLATPQARNYSAELCRFIQILGESKENTIICLKDNSAGFEKGSKKPVISFNRARREDRETTNVAQMNTIEDITIDCGNENEGAIGVMYASSNCGRIENVTVKSNGGFCGIDFDVESEGTVRNVLISGFDYGIRTGRTSPLVMEDIDLSKNNIAGFLTKYGNIVCRNIICKDIPVFSFLKCDLGRYYCSGFTPTYIGDSSGIYIYNETDEEILKIKSSPENFKFKNHDEWVCVEEFGAVADGVTDCTVAIQQAMNSGKETIVFSAGRYRIERTIKIPATVKSIDFRYAAFVPGMSLVVGEIECMFDICENSDDPFFAEHISYDEACPGFYRTFRHSAKRTVVFKDIISLNPLYYNTVGGSEVYFDNCFVGTTHYSQNAVLARDGYIPVFASMIPVEVHGQKVYGKNLNIERADIELLNDNSEICIDGYKTEGPGILIKSINGGKTSLNLFNAAWWGNKLPENALFEMHDSQIYLTGGNVFCYPEDENLSMAFNICEKGNTKRIKLKDCSDEIGSVDPLGRKYGCLIKKWTSNRDI